MRLEAAVGGALLTTSVLCSAAFGHDILAHGLNRRHVDLHIHKRQQALSSPTTTPTPSASPADVFNVPSGIWPTVSIPAGFTLAGGVHITSATTTTRQPAATANAAARKAAVDPAQWNSMTQQACMQAVMKLNGKASNPSGMAACYNIAYLDQQNGTFAAELRIYNVSMPEQQFSGIPQNRMLVTLQYQSAALQVSDGSLPVKRHIERRQATGGVWMAMEVSVRQYVGRINAGSITPGMNDGQLEPLLTPAITITGENAVTGQNVTASLSAKEASFVAGVFSGSSTGNLNDPKFLLGKPVEQLAAQQQGLPTPFVVPGLSLGVFPVGLIVILVWLLAFFSAVGYGTVARIQYRDQYRREFKTSQSGNVKRI